jgi:hypothetical protein
VNALSSTVVHILSNGSLQTTVQYLASGPCISKRGHVGCRKVKIADYSGKETLVLYVTPANRQVTDAHLRLATLMKDKVVKHIFPRKNKRRHVKRQYLRPAAHC